MNSRLEAKDRVSYRNYKSFFEDVVNSNFNIEDVMKAGFHLVEAFRGHGTMTIANAALDSINMILDDYEIDTAKKKNELPLLVGHPFRHPTSSAVIDKLLKEMKA